MEAREQVDCRPTHHLPKAGTLRALVHPHIKIHSEVPGFIDFTCIYCGLRKKTGIARIGNHFGHIKGGIVACPEVPNEVKTEILVFKGLNPDQDYGPPDSQTQPSSQIAGSQPSSLSRSSQESTKTAGQPKLPALFDRAGLHEVNMSLAACFLGLGLPFDIVNHPLFREMCKQINQYKHAYKPLTSYQLRTTYLRDTVAAVQARLKVTNTTFLFL